MKFRTSKEGSNFRGRKYPGMGEEIIINEVLIEWGCDLLEILDCLMNLLELSNFLIKLKIMVHEMYFLDFLFHSFGYENNFTKRHLVSMNIHFMRNLTQPNVPGHTSSYAYWNSHYGSYVNILYNRVEHSALKLVNVFLFFDENFRVRNCIELPLKLFRLILYENSHSDILLNHLDNRNIPTHKSLIAFFSRNLFQSNKYVRTSSDIHWNLGYENCSNVLVISGEHLVSMLRIFVFVFEIRCKFRYEGTRLTIISLKAAITVFCEISKEWG